MKPWMESVDLDDDDLVPSKGSPSAVTVEDTGALDCGVCYHPLKPPIFQCSAGHVVCSQCQDTLKTTGRGKCHVCRVPITGYSRCHAVERLVESVRAPCPHAANGCVARPAYYDRSSHSRTCPYAPYRCPHQPCSFVGVAGPAFLKHLCSVHFHDPAVKRFWVWEIGKAIMMSKLNKAAGHKEDDHEGGVAAKDIELVMIRAGVPRDEAVRSLMDHHGDLVGAILSLVYG